MKAHHMKDELTVTLSEMEENFWKVAEKKLAATWSSPQSAKNYFPARYLEGKEKSSGSAGSPRSGSPIPSSRPSSDTSPTSESAPK